MFFCFGCKTTNPDHFEHSCIVTLNNIICSRCVRLGRPCEFFFEIYLLIIMTVFGFIFILNVLMKRMGEKIV